MQHPALRQRVHFATMRHPAEEPESSASSRSPDSFNGSDSHRTVRAVFCFSAATGRPPRRFCRRVAAIIVGTATATSQQVQPNSSFGRSPSRCLRCERPRPRTTPRRPSIAKQTRSAAGKRGASDENSPTYSRFPATISSKSPCMAQCAPTTPTISPPRGVFEGENAIHLTFFAFRFASLPIPTYLCGNTCPQNFALSVVKWPWLGFFSSPCCRNWW